jgi:hypothetical protein
MGHLLTCNSYFQIAWDKKSCSYGREDGIADGLTIYGPG